MTVFVDDMYKSAMGKYRRMKMSHMVADTEEELHEMADKIGIARKWYQGNHYDISMTKRTEAVNEGAVEVAMRTLSAMMYLKRKTGAFPNHKTATADYLNYRAERRAVE